MRTEETGKNFNKFYVRSAILQEELFGMVTVHDIVDKGNHPRWTRLPGEFDMKFENIANVFNITQKWMKNNLKKKF